MIRLFLQNTVYRFREWRNARSADYVTLSRLNRGNRV